MALNEIQTLHALRDLGMSSQDIVAVMEDLHRTGESHGHGVSVTRSGSAYEIEDQAITYPNTATCPKTGRTYPNDYCLNDTAGYGACIKEANHSDSHADAYGHRWPLSNQEWMAYLARTSSL
jgi:hypothetical protein